MRGLCNRQPLVVGPRIVRKNGRPLHHLRIKPAHEPHMRCRSERRHEVEQAPQRKPEPRYRDRPPLHAALPIDPLLEREAGNQRIYIKRQRTLHQPCHLHGPGPRHEPICQRYRSVPAQREFVIVVDGRGRLLRRDRATCGVAVVQRHASAPLRPPPVERRRCRDALLFIRHAACQR